MKIYPLFFVPIDNAKIAETIVFHPEAPVMKYHQNLSNSCSLSGLASAFHIICDTRAATDLDNHIVESLTLQKYMFRNIIDFANDIRKKKLHNKVEHHLRYNLKRWNNKGGFEILNDMIENVTLVQLMDSLGNMNHVISIVGYCISESNYKQALFMTREPMDLMCSPSVGEEQVVKFETVFFAVRYMREPGNLKIG